MKVSNGVFFNLSLTIAIVIAAVPSRPVIAADLEGEVQVIDGNTIDLAGQRVRLIGIIAPGLDSQCQIGGKSMACGRISRSALLDLTAGQTVRCDIVEGPGKATLARCRAGGYDLSEGMTYTGWARARGSSGERYRRFEADARKYHRGLWRQAPD